MATQWEQAFGNHEIVTSALCHAWAGLEAFRARQCTATLAMLSSSNVKTSLVNKISFTNENLQNQRWHLRETVAELDIENWNLLKESEDLKDGYCDCRPVQAV